MIDPTLFVLTVSSLAALAGALGVLPLLRRERIPAAWLGWSNGLAAGLMLGTAYTLAVVVPGSPLALTTGALIGIGFSWATHRLSGTEELPLNRLDADDPVYGYQVVLLDSLHSASEGVAIGAAMGVDLRFGVFTALALGVHNVPEAAGLCAVLRSRGVRLRDAAGLAVVTNLSEVLFAVAVFAVVRAAPRALPWALGFAVGALIHLVLVELLPESYRQAGHTSIALVTGAAMGCVVLLSGTVG